MKQSSTQEKSPWLSAFRDPVAKLEVCNNSMQLGDIIGDGDSRLIIADLSNRLVCYKGVNIDWESKLNDSPIAIQIFYGSGGNTPTLAVSCDSQVQMYKNLRAIYRFNVPKIEMIQEEKQLWSEYNLDANNFKEFISNLSSLKNKENIKLSNTSLTVLSLTSTRQQYELVKQLKDSNNLDAPDTCVCMAELKIESEALNSPGMLIVGTELGKLYLVNQNGFQIEQTYQLPGTPIQIKTSGNMKDDYKIIVGLRENSIVIISNGQIQKNVVNLSSKLCQFIKQGLFLYVGQMDDSIVSYNLQGVKNFSLKMNSSICALESMDYQRSKFSGIISAMRFGNYGREEGTLILVYEQKGLDVKMLIRQFNFQNYINQAQHSQIQQEQEIKELNLPKKTKIYLENSARERENPIPIHRTFQKDLMKLRLQTAQTYFQTLKEGNVQNMLTNESNLRMHAGISGLGPLFKINFNVENLSSDPLTELHIVYQYDQNIFKLVNPVYEIPFLLPNISYPVEFYVENIDQNGAGDIIKILICEKKQSSPLIGALLSMPLSELKN